MKRVLTRHRSKEPDWDNPNTWFINTYTHLDTHLNAVDDLPAWRPYSKREVPSTFDRAYSLWDGKPIRPSSMRTAGEQSERHYLKEDSEPPERRLKRYDGKARTTDGLWPPDRWLQVFHPKPRGHEAIKEAVLRAMLGTHPSGHGAEGKERE